jgi:hypothetical protein
MQKSSNQEIVYEGFISIKRKSFWSDRFGQIKDGNKFKKK